MAALNAAAPRITDRLCDACRGPLRGRPGASRRAGRRAASSPARPRPRLLHPHRLRVLRRGRGPAVGDRRRRSIRRPRRAARWPAHARDRVRDRARSGPPRARGQGADTRGRPVAVVVGADPADTRTGCASRRTCAGRASRRSRARGTQARKAARGRRHGPRPLRGDRRRRAGRRPRPAARSRRGHAEAGRARRPAGAAQPAGGRLTGRGPAPRLDRPPRTVRSGSRRGPEPRGPPAPTVGDRRRPDSASRTARTRRRGPEGGHRRPAMSVDA